MQALKAWGAKHGKTIDFEFIAHPGAINMPEAIKILN
jgi:hypothetical protein